VALAALLMDFGVIDEALTQPNPIPAPLNCAAARNDAAGKYSGYAALMANCHTAICIPASERLNVVASRMSGRYIYAHMKTIAIPIDEVTLDKVDRLVAQSERLRNRSSAIRLALREFAERELQRQTEEREGAILRKHRGRLARQARMLVREQART
jgi:Arc/MetJ-type ribon-helix-helix transcriptional regulator